jgi:hypothetical protein
MSANKRLGAVVVPGLLPDFSREITPIKMP